MPPRKSDSTTPPEDAPKLPDETQPAEKKKENPPASSDVVAAQAQPMDEQETPVTAVATDVETSSAAPQYAVALQVPGVPLADNVEVKEGEHDPTLVAVPGLGQFRNGTVTMVNENQVKFFLNHLGQSFDSLQLPVGVAIVKEEVSS
jgi:hypothetical protein